MDPKNLKTFREAMQTHGLLMTIEELDEPSRKVERWRYRHLAAMAALAVRAQPALSLTDMTPDTLYAAISAETGLGESTIYNIDELLEALALTEGRGVQVSPFDEPSFRSPSFQRNQHRPHELTAADLDDYVEHIQAAMQSAAEKRPWRVGADRSDFQEEFVIGEPMDLFVGSEPGVMPDTIGLAD